MLLVAQRDRLVVRRHHPDFVAELAPRQYLHVVDGHVMHVSAADAVSCAPCHQHPAPWRHKAASAQDDVSLISKSPRSGWNWRAFGLRTGLEVANQARLEVAEPTCSCVSSCIRALHSRRRLFNTRFPLVAFLCMCGLRFQCATSGHQQEITIDSCTI